MKCQKGRYYCISIATYCGQFSSCSAVNWEITILFSLFFVQKCGKTAIFFVKLSKVFEKRHNVFVTVLPFLDGFLIINQ